MKTLKTLLAVSLLVSSVAPSFAMEEAVQQPVEQQEPVQQPVEDARPTLAGRLADAARGTGNWLKDGFALDYLKDEEGVRHFNRETLGNNKANLAKTAGLYAAVAAAVAGAGYGIYKYFFANNEDESSEEEVVAEPVVNTTPEKAPKAKKPVVKPVAKKAGKTPFKAARGGRFGKSSRVKKHVSRVKAKAKKSCKSCK